jgi:hypothetical protein
LDWFEIGYYILVTSGQVRDSGFEFDILLNQFMLKSKSLDTEGEKSEKRRERKGGSGGEKEWIEEMVIKKYV